MRRAPTLRSILFITCSSPDELSEACLRLAGWLAGSPNILRQAVTVASVKTLEKYEYQANDSGTKSTILSRLNPVASMKTYHAKNIEKPEYLAKL